MNTDNLKTNRTRAHLAAALVGALAFTTTALQAQNAPKMTTDIPPQITTPDSVETRLGTLRFFDGFPDDATVEKVYDHLDFSRGVQAFLHDNQTRSMLQTDAQFPSLGSQSKGIAGEIEPVT